MKEDKKEETTDKPVFQYETYRKYKILGYFAVSLLLFATALFVVPFQLNIDIPSNIVGPLAVISYLGSLAIFIFIWIQLARFRLKGRHMYDERERKIRNNAVYYGMLITIVLSTILIYVIDFFDYDLDNKTLIMIPITILAVSASFFFLYFKRKGEDVY